MGWDPDKVEDDKADLYEDHFESDYFDSDELKEGLFEITGEKKKNEITKEEIKKYFQHVANPN